MVFRAFPTSEVMAGLGLAVIGLSCCVLVQCTRLDAAADKAKSTAEDIVRLNKNVKAEQDARAEESRRVIAQQGIANDVQKKLEKASSNAAAADAASQRMFRSLDADLARARQAAGNTATSGSDEDAAKACVLYAELYGKLVARARPMEQRIRDVNGYADVIRAKGDGLEQAYDSLAPKVKATAP